MAVQAHEVQQLADAVNAEVAAATLKPHEIAKRKVEQTVFRLGALVQRDKAKMLTLLREESDKLVEECRNGTRPRHSFLPRVQEVLAKRLFDSWTEEERADIQIFEGFCFVSKHQWFVVSGEPDEVQEPYWDYLVDPLPVGLLILSKDGAASADVVIIPPMSLWAKNYLGAPEEMMRLAEQREAAQAGG
jgi:hypothetical protein